MTFCWNFFQIFFGMYLSNQVLKHNDTMKTVIQTNKICLFLIVFILCKCDLTWSKVSNHILWLGNIFILLSFKNESETRRLQNKIGGANSFNRREKMSNTFKEWKRRKKWSITNRKKKEKTEQANKKDNKKVNKKTKRFWMTERQWCAAQTYNTKNQSSKNTKRIKQN